ncbi:SAM-dependent methyltransferase TehB [Streptococcus sp. X13SY08]|uniref:SAM-dependent methyltransferase TehB n=1 Tax=Streptococcus sp. X13SY08 TaxID=1676616 RepID=UPI00066FF2E5|nr:SAM-dependent methyltransferase TehB [Streptococcus sp. X13SY08]
MSKALIAYKRMPVWNLETTPETIQKQHNTQVGTWGKLKILKGKLQFEHLSEDGQVVSSQKFGPADDIPMVEPQAWHRVTLLTEDTEFFVEFFCRPEDYFAKKYDIGRAHSEVVEALDTITEPCRVLDLGSGRGRNALYLAKKGFDVTAFDANDMSLEILQAVMEEEDLDLKVADYDINTANLTEEYDWILSTVVFMFLNRQAIPDIISNMQEHTLLGGYNLIVAAMDTEDAPCPLDFPFTFKEGELKDYYKDWELIKYNEDFGQLHERDENGNRIKSVFFSFVNFLFS